MNARLFDRSRRDAEAFETLAEIGQRSSEHLRVIERFTRLSDDVIQYRFTMEDIGGEIVSEATGEPIPDNYPVFGRDAFRTATGVHAAAVIKAKGMEPATP